MRCLMFSTSLFLIPTIFGFQQQHYALSLLSLVCTAVSLNYWRDPVPGPRKDADLVISKIAGIVYFWYGCRNVDDIVMRFAGYVNGACMLLLYNASCQTHAQYLDHWKYYHMGFHASVAIGQMIVLWKFT
jgi:hypothetical protein